ncbi:MAG: hypothetical protein HQM08_23730 [Candidatus Riflebacteria bacterium]|nr:hypothetical protein [Candidatus Riflebacteria bacterium]
MNKCILITYPGITGKAEIIQFKQLSEQLKAHPEGLARFPYFVSCLKTEEAFELYKARKLLLSGPFSVAHRIRFASDFLFEECAYEAQTVALEVEGRKLPELPSRAELEGLLSREKTFILIDGRQFRPNTEVFGFQNVYDNTVKTIDSLKSLGVPNDAVKIFATPDEISIEVHSSVFGIEDSVDLPKIYRALLIKIAGIKRIDRKYLKTWNKTVVMENLNFDSEILLPGTLHSRLHRPKVEVGQSHFAYGPAAFSDYCGKKRTSEECSKEIKSWQKFLESNFEAAPKLVEAVEKLDIIERESTVSAPSTGLPNSEGGFKNFLSDIQSTIQDFPISENILPATFQELNKSLGGGFSNKSLNVFFGNREEGKFSFLISLALSFIQRYNLLFISREQTQREFGVRLLAKLKKISPTDYIAKIGIPGNESAELKKKVGESLTETLETFPKNLFFRGIESNIDPLNFSQVVELTKLLPSGKKTLIFLEGLPKASVTSEFLSELRSSANSNDFAIFVAIHSENQVSQRISVIENADLDFLALAQRFADSIFTMQSEKTNLQKFLTFAQGKVDPAVVQKIEAGFQKASGDKRRFDTYSLLRILHARNGYRQVILYYYQRDLFRFFEGPSIPLSRA